MPRNPFESIPPQSTENQGESTDLIDLEKARNFEEFFSLLKTGLAENRIDKQQAAKATATWLMYIWEDEDQVDYYDDEEGHQVYPTYLYSTDEKIRLLEATESFKPEIVESLVKNFSDDNEVYHFLLHIDEITNYDRSKLVYGLIDAGFGERALGRPDLYEGLDSNALAKHLTEAGESLLVLKHADFFPDIPKRQMVLDLIKINQTGGLARVIPRLDDIPKGEHEQLAIKLIEKGATNEVLENLRSLHLPDKNKIAEAIINAGQVKHLLPKLGFFPDLAPEKVMNAILADRNDRPLRFILADQKESKSLLQRLNIQKNNDFAQKIIKAGKIDVLFNEIHGFENLEEDTAIKLFIHGRGKLKIIGNRQFINLSPRFGLVLIYQGTQESDLRKTAPELLPDESTATWIKKCFEIREDKQIPQKIRLSEENKQAVMAGILESPEVLPDALLARVTHRLSPLEYLALEKSAPRALEKPRENEASLCHELENDPSLIKDENLRHLLKQGREAFSSRIMLEYMNRADMSRHDALYFMPSIIALYNKSGLESETFGNNILIQVAKDQATYNSGSAHHEFATVCQALERIDLGDVKTKLARFSNIKALQELAQGLDVNGPFTSWKSLKKYRDIVQLLARTKILDKLNNPNLPPRMRAFLEKLAFHPNIAMDKVMEFWQEPARFLSIDDHHTSAAINSVKKPSNYISLPHLGLTAEDLRDAYVEGDIDELQTLPPMEKVFENIINEESSDPATPQGLHAALTSALGQEKKGIKGQAARPKKLFDNIKKFCKSAGVDFIVLTGTSETIQTLKPEVRDELEKIIFEPGTGIKKPKGETYRVRIGKKSDPDMTIAGNDTASCMPFGSGKNNVYMFNPNCVQLVVERQTAEGTWRTAAQSVVTIDHEATKTTPELIRGYMQEHQALKDLFNPNDFANPSVITCDNIEIAKNEEGHRYRNIKTVYEKFFREYLSGNAEKLGVDPTRVVIGQGYTPNELGFKSEKNHYVPQAPMGYSDNVHENCFILETGLEERHPERKSEVRPLNVRDAISAAYIEGKAYADNESLMEYLHKVQNNIVGSQIANQYFERPNLSFIAKDEKGMPLGYMIAYEGNADNRRMVYISDLAADPENKMAGPALVRKFIRSYFESYGVGEKSFIPIFTNARERTSYQWILKLAQAEAKKHGALVETVEVGAYRQGVDTMHNMLLLVAKNTEELEALKKKYKQESL